MWKLQHSMKCESKLKINRTKQKVGAEGFPFFWIRQQTSALYQISRKSILGKCVTATFNSMIYTTTCASWSRTDIYVKASSNWNKAPKWFKCHQFKNEQYFWSINLYMRKKVGKNPRMMNRPKVDRCCTYIYIIAHGIIVSEWFCTKQRAMRNNRWCANNDSNLTYVRVNIYRAWKNCSFHYHIYTGKAYW